jgi:hypothetical protein
MAKQIGGTATLEADAVGDLPSRLAALERIQAQTTRSLMALDEALQLGLRNPHQAALVLQEASDAVRAIPGAGDLVDEAEAKRVAVEVCQGVVDRGGKPDADTVYRQVRAKLIEDLGEEEAGSEESTRLGVAAALVRSKTMQGPNVRPR